MTRTFVAVLVAALVSAAPASAQSPAPTPSAAPSAAPVPTPEIYTPVACALLVTSANANKQKISAHTIGLLTDAALRAHDFDALFAASLKARQAAVNAKGTPLGAAALDAASKSVNAAALAVYKAQADVRGCFGMR